ncbi:MAG TPA: hypothetical protein VN888_12490 [Mycobacterium sp.]|nr:hypothetical protein [Mycobacterium sp.]
MASLLRSGFDDDAVERGVGGNREVVRGAVRALLEEVLRAFLPTLHKQFDVVTAYLEDVDERDRSCVVGFGHFLLLLGIA